MAELRPPADSCNTVLSEQNARSALAISDRGYVIEGGSVTLEGPAAELLHSPEIAERYLGKGTGVPSSAASNEMGKRLHDLIWL